MATLRLAIWPPLAGLTTNLEEITNVIKRRVSNGISSLTEFDSNFVEGRERIIYAGDEDEENIIMPDLAEADLLVWFGDLNYRIDISHDDAMELIQRHQIDSLLTQDQLRTEMSAGRTFNGMREGLIRFVPSYKFDPGSQGFEYIYICLSDLNL